MSSPFKDRMGKQLSWPEAKNKISFRLQSYYLEFVTALLWWFGFLPSHTFRNFIFRLSGVKIGSKSYLHIGCRFYDPRNVFIGNDTIIGDHIVLDGRDKLEIGDHVDVASHVMIYNASRNIHTEDFKLVLKPVKIEDYVFIGPRAIILPGVTVRRGAVVAAGAVVTKDVPAKTLVGGVPAKVIRNRDVKEFKYRLGRARLFV